MRSNQEKKVLIYCRQSRDDARANYARIEEQARVLTEFCKNKNLGVIVDTVIDDNVSGTNFARLDGVKEMIRRGEVDIFLCKDSSRLGRLQRESLAFADFLQEYRVELVMESEEYEEDFFGLRAWLNERRAREDGIKSRNALRKRMEAGSMVIKAPYGYIKTGKNELTVDPETAPIVREIYDLCIRGYGKYKIASILNTRGIPTPSQHKEQYANRGYAKLWDKQNVERILQHIIYTGDMPYGMREKVSYKVKKYITKPKEDWIIIPDHHEPIISKEVFRKAQQRFKRDGKYHSRNPAVNIFSGLMFCGRCGSRMYRKTRIKRQPWYSCSLNNCHGGVKDDIREGYGCNPHRIYENALIDYVAAYVDRFMREPTFRAQILAIIGTAEDEKKALLNQISFLQNRIKTSRRKISKIYDDRLDKIITEDLYLQKQDELNTLIVNDEREIEEHKDRLKQLAQQNNAEVSYLRSIEQAKQEGINNQTLSLLFKKIIVFDPHDINEGHINEYEISENERKYLHENGGLLFVQNFRYRTVVTSKDINETAAV
jgi:DNA invertase Pin-like site-specific DNA recombinase